MDNSDISFVKEETIERIKTEPQGDDDELYMCGRPRIKTEDDSNLPGYFNDTINYEPEYSQKSDLQMKSPWDGFLPIKEQVKDESDSLDYEEKAVNTEMKFYDSSLGVMDSRPDHFIVDVKSQDEPDSPDYEDKIVKTEMKDYDSSPGVMESSPNHSNLDVKFQVGPDSPDYEDKIVKTEMKDYDPFPVVTDSSTDYFTPDVKSQRSEIPNEVLGVFPSGLSGC
uniref:Uncharacterized protein n=1 Tax=Timema genevievae TaxID=629358 RepID=A0A7R9K507_TIMGE|nr:unnamed protein product [Timema genevievae]